MEHLLHPCRADPFPLLEDKHREFRKCSEPGCAFSVLKTYPFTRCPWHLTLGMNPKEKVLIIGGGLVVLAAGWGVTKGLEYLSAARRRERLRKGQEEWRQMSEAQQKPDRSPVGTRVWLRPCRQTPSKRAQRVTLNRDFMRAYWS
jgi:hypothetical protein